MICRGLVVIGAILLPLGGAAEAADAAAGEAIAAEHCAPCHYLPGQEDDDEGAVLRAPALDLIASEPTVYTEQRIRTSLQRPHWPMGAIILSPSDIDNILAYFATLRR